MHATHYDFVQTESELIDTYVVFQYWIVVKKKTYICQLFWYNLWTACPHLTFCQLVRVFVFQCGHDYCTLINLNAPSTKALTGGDV